MFAPLFRGYARVGLSATRTHRPVVFRLQHLARRRHAELTLLRLQTICVFVCVYINIETISTFVFTSRGIQLPAVFPFLVAFIIYLFSSTANVALHARNSGRLFKCFRLTP